MLSLQTTDNWAFVLSITVAGFNDSYTNAASANSAYDALQALITWGNLAARPWADTVVFSWTWLRFDASGGALLTLSCSSAFTLAVMSGAWTANTGIGTGAGVTSIAGTTAALGTFAPPNTGHIAIGQWRRLLEGKGAASGNGAVRPGIPGLAHYRPDVSAVCRAQDLARLDAILSDASHPRRCWIYSRIRSEWLKVALGEVSRGRAGYGLWRVRLACVGEAI